MQVLARPYGAGRSLRWAAVRVCAVKREQWARARVLPWRWLCVFNWDVVCARMGTSVPSVVCARERGRGARWLQLCVYMLRRVVVPLRVHVCVCVSLCVLEGAQVVWAQ